jgi:hypothetical protein
MSTPEMATIARFIERLTGSPDTPMRWEWTHEGRWSDDDPSGKPWPPDDERPWPACLWPDPDKPIDRSVYSDPRNGPLSEMKDTVAKHQANGYGMFIHVDDRALRTGGDGKPPERWHQKPDFIVMTDDTWQAYWLVADCPVGEFVAYQLRLADYYGAGYIAPFHTTRVPGTLHFSNPDNPRLVQLVEVREMWEGVRTVDELTRDLPPVGLNRREEWSARFQPSMKGNFYCKIPLALGGGYDVVVFRKDGGWSAVVGGVFSERTYPKPEDAMLATFDYLRGQWERSKTLPKRAA